MVRALGKGFAVAAVAGVAWLLFSVEGFMYSLWALDRDPACQGATSEVCEFNLFAAFLVSGLIGLEALVGTAIAGVLLAVGRLDGAKIVACSLVALLALEHIWLLV
jgi:hypothetical protein